MYYYTATTVKEHGFLLDSTVKTKSVSFIFQELDLSGHDYINTWLSDAISKIIIFRQNKWFAKDLKPWLTLFFPEL